MLTWFAAVFALQAKPELPERLMTRLGGFHYAVSTKIVDAQRFFDQGLACIYGYQYAAARRSFERAAQFDPECAMNYFGIAQSYGPNINAPEVSAESTKLAIKALGRADAAKSATPLERDLIAAVRKRFASDNPKDRTKLNRDYAQAMDGIWRRHPNDPDVGALFAEAKIDLHPWSQWTLDGKPEEGTIEAITALESVLKMNPKHPMGLHLFIHATESSPNPERAFDVANRLMGLQPDLGHMQHMPSHIYVRTGRWKQAVEANLKSIAAYENYIRSRGLDPYATPNVHHDGEMLAYAAAMRGQSALAIKAVDINGFSAEWLAKNAANMDGDLAIPIEILQRFGRWEQILKTPEFDPKLPISRAMRAGAQAVAYSATDRLDAAKREQARFQEILDSIPLDKTDGTNRIHDVLDVERHLVAGEILIRESGHEDAGIAEMKAAVECEDHLKYGLPPSWFQPARHPLGAGFLYLGRYKDAEAVFRKDLQIHPHNGWALIGLSKALRGQKRDREADSALKEFKIAWADADIKIETSCLCLTPKSP